MEARYYCLYICVRCDRRWRRIRNQLDQTDRCQSCRREIPLHQLTGQGLTPYQGRRRCYGYYRCTNCRNTWSSAYSRANKYQKCISCDTKVYPYRQERLRRGLNSSPNRRPHQAHLCQVCIEGGDCLEI